MRFIDILREFWALHRRVILRYGTGALLFLSALVVGKMEVACVVLAGVLLMYAAERWGEPYRQQGEAYSEERRRLLQQRTQELRDSVKEWFQLGKSPPVTAPPPIEQAEEEPAGRSFLHEPPPEPPKPPVTHET